MHKGRSGFIMTGGLLAYRMVHIKKQYHARCPLLTPPKLSFLNPFPKEQGGAMPFTFKDDYFAHCPKLPTAPRPIPYPTIETRI